MGRKNKIQKRLSWIGSRWDLKKKKKDLDLKVKGDQRSKRSGSGRMNERRTSGESTRATRKKGVPPVRAGRERKCGG